MRKKGIAGVELSVVGKTIRNRRPRYWLPAVGRPNAGRLSNVARRRRSDDRQSRGPAHTACAVRLAPGLSRDERGEKGGSSYFFFFFSRRKRSRTFPPPSPLRRPSNKNVWNSRDRRPPLPLTKVPVVFVVFDTDKWRRDKIPENINRQRTSDSILRGENTVNGATTFATTFAYFIALISFYAQQVQNMFHNVCDRIPDA